MQPDHMLFSTGSERADAILRGVTGIWSAVFLGRIRGFYLLGSYAQGSASPASDLDLAILFRGAFLSEAESSAAQSLCENLEALGPKPFVDMWYASEQGLESDELVAPALQLKHSSRLLAGEDARRQISAELDERYVRAAMQAPAYVIRFARPELDKLSYPLAAPDPAGPWLGYDRWGIPAANGGDQPSTRLLITTVGRIATALLALRTGRYAGSKQESTERYCEYVADEWSALVSDVYTLCRVRDGYRIPSGARRRARLRELCEQALAFENHFLTAYRDHFGDLPTL
jgi:hypothetical protein